VGLVGGKYSNDWHVAHLADPRAVVPESVMPSYPFLSRPLRYDDIAAHLKTNRIVGVPYTDDQIANAKADLEAQAAPDADTTDLLKRYPKANVVATTAGTATAGTATEMDALVAYLQMLGTLVKFNDLRLEDLKQ
jgi:cytochrome c oxidase cbb3-type subunit II